MEQSTPPTPPSPDEEARRKRLIQLWVLAFFAAAAVIAALIVISQSGGSDDDDGGGETTSVPSGSVAGAAEVVAEFDGIPQSGTILGDEKAPVTVVEFGDLQCPICKQFSAQVTPQLVDLARSGDIKLEFKQWNIIGPDSKKAASAAMAASEQDRYWQYLTLFYRNQGPENGGFVTPEFTKTIAEGAAIPDIEAWTTASTDPKWASAFDATDSEATDLGFTGTPSISVVGPGGRKDFTGNSVPSISDIQSAIDSLK